MSSQKDIAKALVHEAKDLRDFDRELTPSELELVAAAGEDQDQGNMIDPNN